MTRIMAPPARETGGLHAVRDMLGSSRGQPLPSDTRALMERHLSGYFARGRGRSEAAGALRLGSSSDMHERSAERVATALSHVPAALGNSGVDLSGVRVHIGQRASDSAHGIGALAYTVGYDVVFASGYYAPGTPYGRHVLAHELAHVAQGGHGDGVVRRYTTFNDAMQMRDVSLGWKHPKKKTLRVSDDAQIVSEYNGWGRKAAQRAWTTPTLLALSNATLAGLGSRARLKLKSGGQALSGKAPANKGKAPVDDQAVLLHEIWPERADGEPLDLASDCGSACRQIMGSGDNAVAVIKKPPAVETSGAVTGTKGEAVNDSLVGGAGGRGSSWGARIRAMFTGSAKQEPAAQADASEKDSLTSTPEQWTEDLFRKAFGSQLTRKQAYAAYSALSLTDQDAFDKKYGVGKFAVPRVGQGVMITTEPDMKGYKESTAPLKVNFHYAAAVLASGQDYLALEMFVGWKRDDWIFAMYGPEKNQSFSEDQGKTGQFSNRHSTYVVEAPK